MAEKVAENQKSSRKKYNIYKKTKYMQTIIS